MMIFNLSKMAVTHDTPIRYQLNDIVLNDFLNKEITLTFTGEINCIQCDRKITQSFQQGYCFPCMQKINECNNCMIHPERCLVETGNARCDATNWAHHHCHQPQLIYLANSSGLKVGITQIKNNPTRWIDQGAIQALPIFQTSNRYQAGLIEVALKEFVLDKTNWRVMLRGELAPIDLIRERDRLLVEAKNALAPILKKYLDEIRLFDDHTHIFTYPVLTYPTKIVALSFDKTPTISGVLLGIKGQYLIFDTGVLNIRKFGGYRISFAMKPTEARTK